jgi:hypothetical protein
LAAALVGETPLESKEALRRRTSFAALGIALPMPRCASAVDASARSNGETGGGLGHSSRSGRAVMGSGRAVMGSGGAVMGHASASGSMARGVEGGGGTKALENTGATAEVRGVARAVEQPADDGAVVSADGDESAVVSAATRASSSARSAAASFEAAARAAIAAFSTASACAAAASSASRHSAAANGEGATANGEGATANGEGATAKGDAAMDDFRPLTAPCLSS